MTVVPLATVEPRLVYDVDIAASQDEPGDMPIQPVAFDEWLEDIWRSPSLDLDLSVGVLDAATCVAFTAVETDADRAWSGMTGTLPAYRGRGLAKVAKSVALRRAADAGITTAYTSNDEANAAMLAINTWLGYTRVASAWSVVKGA
jgi:RimJ/RimL family protein N-acetyltransferase